MDLRALTVVGVMLLAGCLGGASDDGVAPTTSASSHPPQPKQVFIKEINACPPPDGKDPPVQTAAATGAFEVKPGYDQLIIAFHESGTGNSISAEIRWKEEGTVVWSSAQHNTAVPPVPCGTHSHTGDGDTKTVEPGNYTVRMSYSGSVALHLEVTARSSKLADMPANHTHMAT
jgi:hypothetical protein